MDDDRNKKKSMNKERPKSTKKEMFKGCFIKKWTGFMCVDVNLKLMELFLYNGTSTEKGHAL